MSGGSYNYLCYRSHGLDVQRGDVVAMADRLFQLGHVAEAEATRRCLDLLDQAEAAATVLEDVWKAVEWADSGDRGLDDVEGEVAKLRAAGPTPDPARRVFRLRLEIAATDALAVQALAALRMVRGVASIEPEEQQ
jgi:hypothetical protein